MRSRPVVVWLMALLSFGGCLITWRLTAMHVGASPPQGWFAQVCSPQTNPANDCTAVLRTKWSAFSFATFSFTEPDPVSGEQPGLPVALGGWIYFSTLLVWWVLVGRCDYRRRRWHLAVLVGVSAACVASAFFVYIMLARMETRCFWCLMAHAINFALLPGTIFLRPKEPPDLAEKRDGGGTVEVHPRPRLVAATMLCAAAVAAAEHFATLRLQHQARAERYRREAAVYRTEVDKIRADKDLQLMIYQGQERVDIGVRADDPVRGDESAGIGLVVFSDFHCRACRRFVLDLESTIIPAFDNRLRVVWKHLPGDGECNPRVSSSVRTGACQAAYAAEAARLQGGNDAFWKAGEALFAAQMKLAELDYGQFAARLGLAPERFLEDMRSEEVRRRVGKDIEQAHALGVAQTPTLFLNGKRVLRHMLYHKPFAEALTAQLLAVPQADVVHPGASPDSRDRPGVQ